MMRFKNKIHAIQAFYKRYLLDNCLTICLFLSFQSKCITVSNVEDTDNVVKRCLDEFHIKVCRRIVQRIENFGFNKTCFDFTKGEFPGY